MIGKFIVIFDNT